MTEDELRSKVIQILRTKKNIRTVRDNCSPIEYGIDIVFVEEDVFGNSRICGVQLKTTNLRSTSSRVRINVKEVIGQLAIAFGHEFPEGRLNTVYIVTTGEINSFASEYISECQTGFREIHLIAKEDLDRFISLGEVELSSMEES